MFGIGQGVDGEQGEKHLFIFNVGFFGFFFFLSLLTMRALGAWERLM